MGEAVALVVSIIGILSAPLLFILVPIGSMLALVWIGHQVLSGAEESLE